MTGRLLIAALSMGVLSFLTAAAAHADAEPAFGNGLADLKTLVGERMGDPLDAEHTVAGASTEQATTTGLAYYLADDNTPAFTSDGIDHWALREGVLLGWQGDSLQPPPAAWAFTPPTAGVSASIADPRSYLYALAPDIAPRLSCIISHESGWNPGAKNKRSSASGLAQFLSGTWAITPQGRAGYSVFNATRNIEAAVWLYRTYGPGQWEVWTKGYCR